MKRPAPRKKRAKRTLPKKTVLPLKAAQNRAVRLVYVNPGDYSKTVAGLLKKLLKQKKNVIYISLTRPYASLASTLQKEKIDVKKLFVIECVSGPNCGAERGVCLESVQNLTSLSMAVAEAVKSSKSQNNFLVLDAVTSLSVYHDSETVSKFLYHLVNKIRILDIEGFLLSYGNDLDPLVEEFLNAYLESALDLRN
ncbi:MAG: hypothetical protein ACE5DI_02780 [Candidatus Micrarchaeia archaeon]